MDIERFTEKAQDAIRAAHALAVRNGQQQIGNEHLLLALLEQDGGVVPAIMKKADLDPAALQKNAQREVQRLPKVSGADEPRVSARLNRTLLKAEDEARQFAD